MTSPPPFPRIPLLEAASGATDDDLYVSRSNRSDWFGTPLVVEEKLDGANVVIWLDETGALRSAGRGGADAMDRAGQFGRLRAWVAEHDAALRTLLDPSEALYGEWLYLEHSLRYERLPDWLVVLDIWHESAGFRPTAVRDERCSKVGLACMPVLWRGAIQSSKDLVKLTQRSAYASGSAEGVVLRREGGGQLQDRSKWLRPDFVRLDDAAWSRGRPTNALDPSRRTSAVDGV